MFKVLEKVLYSPLITRRNCRFMNLYAGGLKTSEKRTEDFVPVYKFPYVRPLSMVNRLKIYQTVLTLGGTPTAFILNQLNYISFEAVKVTALLGISGCISLYSLGLLTDKFIGFIYYNEAEDKVKVSYADFWGRRKDIFIPVHDIVPVNELPIAATDKLFLTFRRYSTKETLRLSLHGNFILDKEKMKKIL